MSTIKNRDRIISLFSNRGDNPNIQLMKRQIQYSFINIISFIIFSLFLGACVNSEEKLQHDLMTVYELETAIKPYNESSQILEIKAQLDYVDLGYLKVDVHPLNVTDENAWRASYIYDDFEGDLFHGQFNIPSKTVGEYEIVFYIVDQNNITTKSSTEIYIDKYPIPTIKQEIQE